jgi:hypothetical protein
MKDGEMLGAPTKRELDGDRMLVRLGIEIRLLYPDKIIIQAPITGLIDGETMKGCHILLPTGFLEGQPPG